MPFQSIITTPVGNGFNTTPKDVVNTRKNLKRLGFNSGDVKNELIDKDLNKAIRGFQSQYQLKVDGIIKPDGETEREMNARLLNASGDIETEDLPPPTIPGTDIPDRGVAESEVISNPRIFDGDKEILKEIPSFYSRMPIFDPRVPIEKNSPHGSRAMK